MSTITDSKHPMMLHETTMHLQMTFRENDTVLLRFSEKSELALGQFHGYLLTKEISREGWQHLAAAAPVSQREKALQPMSQR
jgi:hypothetical protein